MRLIDADALLKQPLDKANYPSNYVREAPTVCDIEQIRAEIEAERDDIASGCVAKYSHDEGYYSGLGWALKIIDKYR